MATLVAYRKDLLGKVRRRLYSPRVPVSFEFDGDFSSSDLAVALKSAVRVSRGHTKALPGWVQRMEGMSGRRYRSFVNSLVAQVRDPVYLEVGSWSGSTASAAIVNNRCQAICIDDFRGFGGPRDDFMRNIARAAGRTAQYQILEEDFRKVKFADLFPRANIYLFDGPHSEQDHFDGVSMALPALTSRFILLVDDYNMSDVRLGTARALAANKLSVEASVTIRTDVDGPPVRHMQRSDWHRGYFFGVVKQSRNGD